MRQDDVCQHHQHCGWWMGSMLWISLRWDRDEAMKSNGRFGYIIGRSGLCGWGIPIITSGTYRCIAFLVLSFEKIIKRNAIRFEIEQK